MWHDPTTNTIHMLSHNGNIMGTTCGKHYFARGGDLLLWRTNGCAYQAKPSAKSMAVQTNNTPRALINSLKKQAIAKL